MASDHDRAEANAKIAHETRLRAALAGDAPVITFAVEALKSAVLVNGGTAGALLAFVGQKGIQAQPGLGEAFYWFASGLLFGALASAGSYIAQFCYARAIRSYICTWTYPYVEDTPEYKRWNRAAVCAHIASILLVVTSFSAAIRGFWVAAKSLPF